MAPDNVSPPSMRNELPHLEDRSLELWLQFLADEVDCLAKKMTNCQPRLLRLESSIKYVWGAFLVVSGVLFGHLGWK